MHSLLIFYIERRFLMHRAYGGKFLYTSDFAQGESTSQERQLLGINLGRANCAEHEWGITPLKKEFGTPSVGILTVGAESRRVNFVPKGLKFFENLNGYSYLFFLPVGEWKAGGEKVVAYWNYILCNKEDEEFVTAWDSSSFGIRTMNEQSTHLREIYVSFMSNDVLLFLSNEDSFASGLNIIINSRMPRDIITRMREYDYHILRTPDF